MNLLGSSLDHIWIPKIMTYGWWRWCVYICIEYCVCAKESIREMATGKRTESKWHEWCIFWGKFLWLFNAAETSTCKYMQIMDKCSCYSPNSSSATASENWSWKRNASCASFSIRSFPPIFRNWNGSVSRKCCITSEKNVNQQRKLRRTSAAFEWVNSENTVCFACTTCITNDDVWL